MSQFIMMGSFMGISHLINVLIERLLHIGEVPICNGIASRAPHIFGFCFPLCYRCSFVMVGFVLGYVLMYKGKVKISWIVSVLLLLPMIVDGSLQTFMGIMCHNINRIVTGFLFGLGLSSLVYKAHVKIDNL